MRTDDGSRREARRIGLEQSLDLRLQALGRAFIKRPGAGGLTLRW
jgi:hypothetical protein